MEDLNDKITGNSLTANEWNQPMSELQNVITDLGQALSSGDLDQLGKSIAGYVAHGLFYTDSGAANAYVLTKIGLKQQAPAYDDGYLAKFRAGNANTGASTVNIGGLGAKSIFHKGAALVGGEILANQYCTIIYDEANDRFDLIPDMEGIITDGNSMAVGTAEPGLNLAGSTGDRTGTVVHVKDGTNAGRVIIEGTAGGAVLEMYDLGGAADDKGLVFTVDGGIATLISVNDNLTTRTDNILIADLGTGGLRSGAGLTDQGAGTLNVLNGVYVNDVQISSADDVANYDKSGHIFMDSDPGAVAGNQIITVLDNAGTPESFGPTGSTADNIWTAMNDIPTTANWVRLKLVGQVTGSGTADKLYTGQLFGRPDGSAAGNDDVSLVVQESFISNTTGSETIDFIQFFEVPLDANRRFELARDENGTGGTLLGDMYVVGWGE